MGELVLLRHGQTEWSLSGRHTGRTDIGLTAEGEAAAARWAPSLGARAFAAVLTSPLLRARRTAELAGLVATGVDGDLCEWDYGPVEGRTTAELRETRPGWDIWVDGVGDGGESLDAVGARCDALLERVAEPLARGDVALVAHGHVLRILTARWLGLPPVAGSRLALDAGSLGVLGHERERAVLHAWGLRPPA